jgi:hypothetical protein
VKSTALKGIVEKNSKETDDTKAHEPLPTLAC